jgi:hypothetical protein
MMRRIAVGVVCGGLLVVAAGCKDEGPQPERFEAALTGAAERPNPVVTNATGSATFTVRNGSVDFSINAANLVGATAAHIHGPGTAEQAVGVIVTLFGATAPGINVPSGVLNAGSFPSATFTIRTGVSLDSVLFLMRNNLAYVNVHTVTRPGGEIRGHITRR